MKRVKLKKFLITCFCLLWLGLGFISAQQAKSSSSEQTAAVKEAKYPKKRKSQETWEIILSFPGKIIAFPFKVVFKAAAGVAVFLDESHVLTRLNDILNSDDGRRSLLPEYSPYTGAGLVFSQQGLVTAPSIFSIHASLGARWRRGLSTSLERIQLKKNISGALNLHYYLLTDEYFFGRGNKSVLTNKTNYSHEQAALGFSLGIKLGRKTSAGIWFGFERNNIRSGRNPALPSTNDPAWYTENILPGIQDKVNLGTMDFTFRYDGKDHQGHPRSGSEVLIQGELANDLAGQDFGFSKFSLDVSQYLRLFIDRILVLRIRAEFTDPLPGKRTPFYYLSEIGRRETVRGYLRGQFRDRDLLLGSVEYRYPIWRLLDALLFIDAGKVSPNIFRKFTFSDFHIGYGGGLRLWGDKGMIAKMEIAWGKDGVRIYFVLGKGIIG